MNKKVHVKEGDTVIVLSGKNARAKGKVLKVLAKDNRVIVEKVNVTKKHQKPRNQMQQGGIVEREAPIHSSNVMLVCPRCSKPTKVGKYVGENKEKSRVCKKCNETIDTIREAGK